jgi:hypothetical protein
MSSTNETSATDLDRTKSTFREKAGFAAIIAALSGLVGLLSALAALYSQVEPAVSAAIKRDFAPVGTVVASVLDPISFAEMIGEQEGDSYTKRRWILADGREVNGTAYARATKGKSVPNLQNMFLRGIDLKNKREAGDIQKYSTALPAKPFTGVTSADGLHEHPGVVAPPSPPNGERYNAGGSNYPVPFPAKTGMAGDHSHQVTIAAGGDAETRPDNVAVYYYIKIN